MVPVRNMLAGLKKSAKNYKPSIVFTATVTNAMSMAAKRPQALMGPIARSTHAFVATA